MLQPGRSRRRSSSTSHGVLSGGSRACSARLHPQFGRTSLFVNYARGDHGERRHRDRGVPGCPRAIRTCRPTRSTLLVDRAAVRQPQRRHARVRSRRLPLHRHGRRRLAATIRGNRAQNIDDAARQDPAHRRRSLRTAPAVLVAADNPFFGATPGRDEIFAYRHAQPMALLLRPRQTGQLYVGDVGQDAREEIDIVDPRRQLWLATSGKARSAPAIDPRLCNTGRLHRSDHRTTRTRTGAAPSPEAMCTAASRATLPAGTYVYGDMQRRDLHQFLGGKESVLLDTGLNISSFGEDEAGEIYVVGWAAPCIASPASWSARSLSRPRPLGPGGGRSGRRRDSDRA